MTNKADLLRIKKWFEIYVRNFYTGVEADDSAIRLKAQHTRNVALEILDISRSLGLGAEHRSLAEIMAILHDIGRFEQYSRYHTYSDMKSENHASLGLRVINDTGVLIGLESADIDLITAVISYHNRAVLPQSDDETFIFFLKLLRDADKIDILRVVTEHYQGVSTNDIVQIGLPDLPEVSDGIVESIMSAKVARIEDVRTFNDFKLLQIGWVFDINFPRTFEILRQRRYVEKIRNALPDISSISQAVAAAIQHVEFNCFNTERNSSICRIP